MYIDRVMDHLTQSNYAHTSRKGVHKLAAMLTHFDVAINVLNYN